MARSFGKTAPRVKPDDDGPLFRAGEIWERAAFIKRLGGDEGRKFNRLEQAGLKVWDAAGTGLVLIDQLADLIRANAVVPPKFEAKYKQRNRRKKE